MRTALLALAAMLCFAANSLLSRAALRGGLIDAASFTAIRLACGAAVLAVLATARRDKLSGGSWISAAALATYAVAFTFAYRELTAGTGALLLFGAVQLTMIGGALLRGERPAPVQWLGWLVAIGGLGVITAPTLDPPPLVGTLLMLGAGIAWGVYSLRGRGVARPLATTADNFIRTVPVALALILFARHVTPEGALLAAASGGLASGIGYSIWYAAVPSLGATRSAAVQLSVPVLTALAAMILFGEILTPTLAAGGSAIVVGLALALIRRR